MEIYSQGFFFEKKGFDVRESYSGFMAPYEVVKFVERQFQEINKDPTQFFVNLASEKQKPYWLIICFENELEIAGHLALSRGDAKIRFGPYSTPINPSDPSFIPKIGVILIENEEDLNTVKDNSMIFKKVWKVLNKIVDNDYKFVCFDIEKDIESNLLYEAIADNEILWGQYLKKRK